ncbi:MAG: dihydroorotate dehydrogenase electron transfer subunit [Clostridiales bacterium]|nr:dihydroorotate dehydrogenase electron transfer subunit [Clostridiales bacterium]
MSEKSITRAIILSQEKIASQIYSLWLEAGTIAKNAVPGQFVSVYSNDSGRLLPRPISICETDPSKGLLRLVYRVAGRGTEEFSGYQAGDSLDILGPLGNGFPLERCPGGKSAFLIGGGIGLPPMVELSKRLQGHALVIAGYRDELFLTEELAKNGTLYFSVEDDSFMSRLSAMQASSHITHGNVLDCIRENGLHADVIYACGPAPMLRAVKSYAQQNEIECWLSLEQRMACGIGACLACVCESTAVDAHSQVKNKRVCKEGPVFAAEDVNL